MTITVLFPTPVVVPHVVVVRLCLGGSGWDFIVIVIHLDIGIGQSQWCSHQRADEFHAGLYIFFLHSLVAFSVLRSDFR